MIYDQKLISDFERHVRILQALSESSVKVYRKKIDEFLVWAEKERCEIPLSRADIEQYMEVCFYAGNSNITRFSKLTAIRKFFRYLIYAGLMSEDPTEKIPRPRQRKKFIQFFTQTEVLKIFGAIDISREIGLRDAVIVILAAFAGLRVSEITGLTLQDIIDDGKSLDLQVTGKFDKVRRLYLWKAPSEHLRRLISIRLSQHPRASDPLIVSYRRGSVVRGSRMGISMLDRICKKYAAAAGIHKPKISMHMFRATHANDLRHIAGYDTPAIAERLGHESIATTDNYIAARGRIHRQYPSLAVYWKEFNLLWKETPHAASPTDDTKKYGGARDDDEV
jgi:integrase/recombinase XerD